MSKVELPKLPHVARRVDEIRRKYRGVRADVIGFGQIALARGKTFAVEKRVQCYFDAARLILAVDGNAKNVMLTRMMFGAEMVFEGDLAASFFLDHIPTRPEIAVTDEWDDGGRVEYPRLAPGIAVELTFENRSDGHATIAPALLGLSSHSPFPWDEFEAAPWDRTQR